MGEETPASAIPHGEPDNTLYIPLNANIIKTAFATASTPEEKLFYKRHFSLAIHYLRCHGPPTGDLAARLDTLSLLLQELSAIPFCRPISVPSGSSLLEILDTVIVNNDFLFGPATQKPGEAKGESRFICVFCHKVRTRTGDLRVHLREEHKFGDGDIDQAIKSPRLRVFGQYSYMDVILNNWEIPEWRPRRSRGSQTNAGEEPSTSSQKRKTRHGSPERSSQTYADCHGEGSSSVKRCQSSRGHDYTTSASQAMSCGGSSTVATTLGMDDIQHDLVESSLDACGPGDDDPAVAHFPGDGEMLIEVGSVYNEQQEMNTPEPVEKTNPRYSPSVAPSPANLQNPASLDVPYLWDLLLDMCSKEDHVTTTQDGRDTS